VSVEGSNQASEYRESGIMRVERATSESRTQHKKVVDKKKRGRFIGRHSIASIKKKMKLESTLAVFRFFTESSKNKQRLPSSFGTPATLMAHSNASGECLVAKLHALQSMIPRNKSSIPSLFKHRCAWLATEAVNTHRGTLIFNSVARSF